MIEGGRLWEAPMSSRATKLTVTAPHFLPGDLVRMTSTGDTFYVSSQHTRFVTRHLRQRFAWRSLWSWLRGKGWRDYHVSVQPIHTVRVWKTRPSPLPRRLP